MIAADYDAGENIELSLFVNLLIFIEDITHMHFLLGKC